MKSRSDQLELPLIPHAEVLPFPATRMIGELRDSAAEILSMPPEKRASRITFRSKLLWLHFVRAGVPSSIAAQEEEAYRRALEAALDRDRVVSLLFGNDREVVR